MADIAFCASTRPSISRTPPWQTSQCPQGPEFFAEHGQKRLAAAARGFTKRHKVVELVRLDALALLGRPVIEDLASPEFDVPCAVEA